MKLNATRTQCSQNAVRTQQKRRTQGRTPSTLQNAERIVLVHLSCCCARVICWAIPKSLHVAEPRRSGATDLVVGPSARSTTQTNSNKSINNSSSPSPNACPPPLFPPPLVRPCSFRRRRRRRRPYLLHRSRLPPMQLINLPTIIRRHLAQVCMFVQL